MRRHLAIALVAAAAMAVLAGWWWPLRPADTPQEPRAERGTTGHVDAAWLDELRSVHPREAAAAAARIAELGVSALPAIHAALQDPGAPRERRKAALKAAAILGPVASPTIETVAPHLHDPDLAADAGTALSHMGQQAYGPLVSGVADPHPVVRREALRAIGKLYGRAELEPDDVVPLLVDGMLDLDPGVRAVGATYLGIIGEMPEESVPALMAGLVDPESDVRRLSAAALASFGPDAAPALPALRRAATDRDPEVAREAGRALVKLQEGS